MTTLVIAMQVCGHASDANLNLLKSDWATVLPQFWSQVSYGKVSFSPSVDFNRVVMVQVPVPCSGFTALGSPWSAYSCTDKERLGWAEAADAYVNTTLGINVDRYRHRMYFIPDGTGCTRDVHLSLGEMNCGQEGPKDRPVLRAWMNQGYIDAWDLVSAVHEFGHNLGMMHSQAYGPDGLVGEYGDGSCPMGGANQLTQFNPAQTYIMGWGSPIQVLGKTELPPGVWKSWVLPALATSPNNILQIVPASWMPKTDTKWGLGAQLFIGFRRRGLQADMQLDPSYSDKVELHRWAGTPTMYGCARTLLLDTLGASSSNSFWPTAGSTAPGDLSSPQLAVRVDSISPSDGSPATAKVSLCRWQDADSKAKCGVA